MAWRASLGITSTPACRRRVYARVMVKVPSWAEARVGSLIQSCKPGEGSQSSTLSRRRDWWQDSLTESGVVGSTCLPDVVPQTPFWFLDNRRRSDHCTCSPDHCMCPVHFNQKRGKPIRANALMCILFSFVFLNLSPYPIRVLCCVF